LRTWAQLDQGQAIVVQNGLILGAEAAEGTDELIRRCGTYKRSGRGPILVKIKKPQQDARMDLPTIGTETVRLAADAGFSGIAVQTGNALFLHPVVAIAEADAKKLFLIGFEPKS
jgi:UDP-2,3-diacylglucosamine hydrolase